MSSSKEVIKTIRVIKFSGKDADWNRWSKTFRAMSVTKGYNDVLNPKNPSIKQDLDENTMAYGDLLLACQEDLSFGIVEESTSTNFPDGDARLAWKNLKRRYKPIDGAALI